MKGTSPNDKEEDEEEQMSVIGQVEGSYNFIMVPPDLTIAKNH